MSRDTIKPPSETFQRGHVVLCQKTAIPLSGNFHEVSAGVTHDINAIGHSCAPLVLRQRAGNPLATDHTALQVVALVLIGIKVPNVFNFFVHSGRNLFGVNTLQPEVVHLEPSVAVVRGACAVCFEVAGANAEFQALAVLERHHDSHGAERHLTCRGRAVVCECVCFASGEHGGLIVAFLAVVLHVLVGEEAAVGELVFLYAEQTCDEVCACAELGGGNGLREFVGVGHWFSAGPEDVDAPQVLGILIDAPRVAVCDVCRCPAIRHFSYHAALRIEFASVAVFEVGIGQEVCEVILSGSEWNACNGTDAEAGVHEVDAYGDGSCFHACVVNSCGDVALRHRFVPCFSSFSLFDGDDGWRLSLNGDGSAQVVGSVESERRQASYLNDVESFLYGHGVFDIGSCAGG